MRLKGILLAALLVAALAVACGSMGFSPMFDMPKWTTATYPTFVDGCMSNLPTPVFSTGGIDLQQVKYSPIFDMSPGSFSFNTFPTFSGSGSPGAGVVYGMMTGMMFGSF